MAGELLRYLTGINMYRSYKNTTIAKIVDTIDFYCCELYDTLWGEKIYRWAPYGNWSWHRRLAYKVAQWLPPSPHAIKYLILKPLKYSPMQRNIKRLEIELFGDNEPIQPPTKRRGG